MNIADYLSELLSQHDEVSLPCLGYFVREQASGIIMINLLNFIPVSPGKVCRGVVETMILLPNMLPIKRISRWHLRNTFVEKFINTLKDDCHQASTYIFSDLGQFHTYPGAIDPLTLMIK